MVSRLTDQVGRVVNGRYRITASLGGGASAHVWLAEDVQLGRPVALKMLAAHLAEDEPFLRRFRAEARAVAALSHPNILTVHDWGEADVPFLVTEYLAGGSLRGMLASGARLSPAQALVVGLEACRGLSFAHGAGLVHRDLKPANLLFDDQGRLRIADFGLARAIAEAGTTDSDGSLLGTARYAAPEQARGERLDGKADVYALGLTLIEAVTGKVPFRADTTIGTLMARLDRDVEVPARLGPLARTLERVGKLDPGQRPDADELSILLLSVSERLDAPAPLPLVGATEESSLRVAPSPDERTTIAPLPLDLGRSEAADGPDGTGPTSRAPAGATERTVAVDGAGSSLRSDASVEGPAATADSRRPSDHGGDDGGDSGDEGRSGRSPIRRVLRLVAAVAVVIAVVAGGVLYLGAQDTSEVVPELAGTTIDDLEILAAEYGWVLDTKKTRRTGTDPGEIVSTEPGAGAELDEGDTLVVLVSEGAELTTRPDDVAGRPLAEVEADFDIAGLAVSTTEVHDEDVVSGSVIGFDGDVDLELPEGTVVPLVVSTGPEPRTVPDLPTGATRSDAVEILRELRLVPVVTEVFSDDVPVGVVMGITPSPGATVERDSEVELVVSKGPDLVTVPDVVGLTLDEAEVQLERSGLVLGQDCCNSRGTVVASEPDAGADVRRGSSVNVLMSR